MKILLVTPPFIHCNTVYPATPYLTAFVRNCGYNAVQADASLQLMATVLSKKGLEDILAHLPLRQDHPSIQFFKDHFVEYSTVIEPVMRFLQGKDHSVSHRIVTGRYLPEGPRFSVVATYESFFERGIFELFGTLGTFDCAQHMASLFIDDIFDVIKAGIDPYFGIEQYGEYAGSHFHTYDIFFKKLQEKTIIDSYIDAIAVQLMQDHAPQIVGFTVPFPGTLYGALRLGQQMKRITPSVKIIMGGGYVSTELRHLSEKRIFSIVDYFCLDDGMQPLVSLIEHIQNPKAQSMMVRTYYLCNNQICFESDTGKQDIPFSQWPVPLYDGLHLKDYFTTAEMANPLFRLWSSVRWNKIMLSHGCYWHKCSFCDTSLEYIKRFETTTITRLVDSIERVIEQTEQTGFHFVDEAIPPKILRLLAEELQKRNMCISFWGNIRFEDSFTDDLVESLARSGCIAVAGGIEACTQRLIQLLNKGLTLHQIAKTTQRFAKKGIMVHAYCMYGVPTETLQETIDSLEFVRNLFVQGSIHSCHWHRFSATIHSDIGKHPEQYGIRLRIPQNPTFALNDVVFEDSVKTNHDLLGEGLHKAAYNYMHGLGLERDVRSWFSIKVPKPRSGEK